VGSGSQPRASLVSRPFVAQPVGGGKGLEVGGNRPDHLSPSVEIDP
jgi:hypothetical protein